MANTPNKDLELPAHGSEIDTWDVPVNSNSTDIDTAFGGTASINATAASGTVALSAAQYVPRFIVVSGTLTAAVNYQFPAGVRGQWYVTNSTTGAFSLTFSSADGGTSVVVAQGSRVDLNSTSTGVRVGSASSGANSDITSLSGLTTPLSVPQGGTGLATLASGAIPKGNGTSAFSAATPGTDYAKPDTASTWTASQTLSGSASTIAEILTNAAEGVTISATAATGTITAYFNSQSFLYFTTAAAANWALNLAFSAGTPLNTAMTTGQAMTFVFAVTQGATAYYNSSVLIDGTAVGVTTKWQGAAPTFGGVSGIDVYSYTVMKTGSAAFTVFASVASYV